MARLGMDKSCKGLEVWNQKGGWWVGGVSGESGGHTVQSM